MGLSVSLSAVRRLLSIFVEDSGVCATSVVSGCGGESMSILVVFFSPLRPLELLSEVLVMLGSLCTIMAEYLVLVSRA